MQAASKQVDGQAIQRVEVVREVPAALGDVDVLAIIERRNEMLTRILSYALKSTHAGQWTDQQGKPFPTAAAAEVMARRCAVRIERVHTEKVPSNDDKGQFYLYVATCTASLPGEFDSLQAMGTCSSRDAFLGTETRSGRQLSEIDEGNILKAAYSNMLVNAITRLLGVRNLTWEQLAQYGIHKDGAAKVEYNAGSRGGTAAANQSGAVGLTIKFGSAKGKTIPELSDKDLAYYLKSAKESVAKNDPKWHTGNVAMHDALEAERARRASPAKTAPAGGKSSTSVQEAASRATENWDGYEPPPPGDEDAPF